eukprot:18190-Heterococcus_DN1.PRE.1
MLCYSEYVCSETTQIAKVSTMATRIALHVGCSRIGRRTVHTACHQHAQRTHCMYTRCAHCSGLTSAACLHYIDLPTYEQALYVMAMQTGTYAAKQDCATVSAACAQQQQPDRPLQLSESALHHRVSCAGACLQLMPVHASITKLLIKSHYKGTAVAAAACAQNTAHTKTVIPT